MFEMWIIGDKKSGGVLESEKQSWILKIEGQIGCGKNYETVGFVSILSCLC